MSTNCYFCGKPIVGDSVGFTTVNTVDGIANVSICNDCKYSLGDDANNKIVKFIVKGRPSPKERPRFCYSKNGRLHVFTPVKTGSFEEIVAMSWKEQSNVCFDGKVPLKASLVFYFAVPKSWSQKKKKFMIGKPMISRPDLDNLEKSIYDALNGYAYEDDSCIVSHSTRKMYGNCDMVSITIEEYR